MMVAARWLAALLLLAEQMAMGGKRGADHRGILGVQLDHQPDVIGVQADQAHDVLRLGSGGDALGGEVGFVRVDWQEGGHLGDGGVVSGAEGFLRLVERWGGEVG